MSVFGAVDFYEVENGTEFEDPETGEKHVDTDDTAVFRGHRAYVTAKMMERFRNHPDIKEGPSHDR